MEVGSTDHAKGEVAYRLFWDTSHLVDGEHDASLVRFPGSENIAGWISSRERAVPERIYFEANFQVLQWIDYPESNVDWPLLSPHLLAVLRSTGTLPKHRLVRVTMLDDTVPSATRFDAAGNPKPGVADDRFSCLHLLEHTDAFDWEHSVYEKHERLPNRVAEISKLVLKEPQGGFPPVFRLSASPSILLVSAAARQALEAAKVTGCVFWSLDKTRV